MCFIIILYTFIVVKRFMILTVAPGDMIFSRGKKTVFEFIPYSTCSALFEVQPCCSALISALSITMYSDYLA